MDISERGARVALELTAYAHQIEGRVRVHLAAALPKGDRQTVMLDMVTQIGMTDFTPLLCERSVAKFSIRSAARWQKTCLEACKQSQRLWVPRLHQPKLLAEMFNTDGGAGRVVWLADPRGGYPAAVQKLKADELILLVGPEGGFSPSEWKLLSDTDIEPVTLAKNRIADRDCSCGDGQRCYNQAGCLGRQLFYTALLGFKLCNCTTGRF